MTLRSSACVLLGIAVLLPTLLFAGCVPSRDQSAPEAAAPTSTADRSTTPPPPPAVETPTVATAVSARGAQLDVYDAPDGVIVRTLANPQESGAPLILLVAADQGDWMQVALAQRPNGSTGWVRSDAVTAHTIAYRLEVSTSTNTLVLRENGRPVKTDDIATGTGGTPTPHGSFFLTELLAPTNDGYGPYAFGLSAFSEVLSEFGGGSGQIGLHGTDDEDSIGQSASHGCIRLSNDDITELAGLLPLGTPIDIG